MINWVQAVGKDQNLKHKMFIKISEFLGIPLEIYFLVEITNYNSKINENLGSEKKSLKIIKYLGGM